MLNKCSHTVVTVIHGPHSNALVASKAPLYRCIGNPT